MQHYRRNPPNKSFFAYLIPFLILITFGLTIFLLIRFWGNLDERMDSETAYARMETLEGEAKVMLFSETEWKSVPGSAIKLYKGDSIRALPGGKVKVTLFDRHFITLNGDSELVINELRKDKETKHISLELSRGQAWFKVAREINPDSTFMVKTQYLQVATQGSEIDLENGIVRVLKGSVDAKVYDGATLLKETNVGVGQQFVLTDSLFRGLQNQDEGLELVSMLSDEFKLSDWYLFNAQGKRIGESNTGTVTSDVLNEANEDYVDDSVDEPETNAGQDSSAPNSADDFELAKPIITSPAEDGEEYTVTSSSQRIEGKVKRGTAKVVVNTYELQSFQKGDTAWKYNAAVKFGNLEKGRNEYDVYAYDEQGNKSEVATITLIYEPSETEEEEAESTTPASEIESETETSSEAEAEETAPVTGSLQITEPNGGTDFTSSETSFVISGTAPSNAAKIVVSGYELTTFDLGDTAWKYTADPKYENISIGESNTYTVVAYDADGNVLASEDLVITVEAQDETEE